MKGRTPQINSTFFSTIFHLRLHFQSLINSGIYNSLIYSIVTFSSYFRDFSEIHQCSSSSFHRSSIGSGIFDEQLKAYSTNLDF